MKEKEKILDILILIGIVIIVSLYWFFIIKITNETERLYERKINIERVGEMPMINQNTLIGITPPAPMKFEVLAVVTAYTPAPEETDDTPEIMASGAKVYKGAIACPRNIKLGTIVEIDGQTYRCEDRTHLKYNGRFDILMFSKKEAKEFGRQIKKVKIY